MLNAAIFAPLTHGCAPNSDPITDAGTNSMSADAGSAPCDPHTNPCRTVERADTTCRFPGTPPGGLPQLRLLEAAFSADSRVVAGAAGVDGPLFALENGVIIDSDGIEIVRLAHTPIAVVAVPDDEDRFVYSANEGGDLIVMDVDPTMSEELFRVRFSGGAMGGGVGITPDNVLFVGVGDDDSDELAAQDATTWYGSVLRVQLGTLGTFAIPPDNPFDGTNGAAEVYATGLHDPRSIMVGTDRVLVSDHGEQFDEVNSVTARANFGWPYLDGTYCLIGSCSPQYDGPLARHATNGPDCGVVTGGQFAPDHSAEELRGVYLYADTCDGSLYGLRVAPNGRVATDVLTLSEDPAVGFAGPERLISSAVHEVALADDAAAALFPTRLSEANCFDVTDTGLRPVPGVIPYFVRSPLWTDGATKRRWLVLPAQETAAVDDSGHLLFPTGSLLLKEFAFDFGDGTRAVEMRVMRRNTRTWSFFTYRFDEQGEGTIVDGKDEATFDVWLDDEPVAVDYLFPDSSSCRTCHNSSRRVLGPRLDQLAGPLDYGDDVRDQLSDLARLEIIEHTEVPPLPDPSDPATPTDERARAYLDANCGHCHRPGGWVPPDLTLDLRYSTALPDMHACGVRMQYPSPFVAGDYRIVPGDPEASALFQRMQTRGLGQMPLLATSIVDPLATEIIAAWIEDLDCAIQ